MREKKPPKPDLKKIFLIIETLKKFEDWIWLRELARRCKLPVSTVHFYLENYLNPFIEEINTSQFISSIEEGKYPKLRLIKLKKGVSFEKVVKWMNIREKLT